MDEAMMAQPEDMAADPMGEEMPAGNSLTFDVAEYPQLEGAKPGSQVSIQCTGVVGESAEGQVTISIEGQCEIETESPATREYNQMRGANTYGKGSDDGGGATADDEF